MKEEFELNDRGGGAQWSGVIYSSQRGVRGTSSGVQRIHLTSRTLRPSETGIVPQSRPGSWWPSETGIVPTVSSWVLVSRKTMSHNRTKEEVPGVYRQTRDDPCVTSKGKGRTSQWVSVFVGTERLVRGSEGWKVRGGQVGPP